MKSYLRAAWLFGMAPLVTGITIFLAWALFQYDFLVIAGFFTIGAGILSIVIAAICLGVACHKAGQSGEVAFRRCTRHAAALIVLFAINFIAAGACVAGAVSIMSCYTLTITNNSDQPLQMASLDAGGVIIELEDIPAQQSLKTRFWIEGEGELVLTGKHGSSSVEFLVDDYVTNSLGGNKQVTIDASGELDVQQR